MEYFFYANELWCDLDKLEPYVVKRYRNNTISKTVFDDNNYEKFIKDFNLSEYNRIFSDFTVLGVNGYIYTITPNGSIKGEKYPANYPKLILNNQNKMRKSFYSDTKFKDQVLKDLTYGNAEKYASGILGFNKYLYANKKIGCVIPYRFKKAKHKNQPLIIYFAGGGTIGHDNWNPLREFLYFSGSNKVIKSGCNILIPQIMRAWDRNDTDETIRNRFVGECAILIKQLLKNFDIDSNRIYIYGTSLGAGFVWHALFKSPELYNAAVEAMGEFVNYKKLNDTDFEKISHIPIWLAHSSDDVAVSIASDDYIYDKLKSLGANVKYTRWEEHGHRMAAKFYKEEPWVDWLFEQGK